MASLLTTFVSRVRSAVSAPTPAVRLEPVTISAAAPLPSSPPPKRVRPGQVSSPSYLKSARPSTESALQIDDRRLGSTDITTLRSGATTRSTLRAFRLASPDLSAAVQAYVRTGVTSGFKAMARNMDGTVNPEATRSLAQIISRFNVLSDYSVGYDDAPTMRSVSESWAVELVTYGSCCGELVLDKARLPDSVQPISTTQIHFYPSADGKRKIPEQWLAGQHIVLDQPTFFYVSLDQDLLDPYSISPIETALQPVLFTADFMNDVRRIVKKAIHPRNIVTIDEELFRKNIPLDIQADQEKLTAHLNTTIEGLAEQINGLEPEEALVLFSSIEIKMLDRGSSTLSNEYDVIQGLADSKLGAGTKVLPSILGKSGGTANTASAEVLQFMKTVEGTVWAKLNEMWSKILTLAVRLQAYDVVVEFSYDPIDLRPKSELEAFEAMRQSRLLEQLSLGFITDEEACIRLTGNLPPAGYINKSGTGFRANTTTAPAGDGFNGATNNGSALNNANKPTTPTNAKSQNGGKSAPNGADTILHVVQ